MVNQKLSEEEKLKRTEERKRNEWNKKHQIINGLIYKWCPLGEHWERMDKEHFSLANWISDGFYTYCKKCNTKDTQKWRAENPENYKQLNEKSNANPSDKTIQKFRENSKRRRENGDYERWQKNNPDKVKNNNIYRHMHKIHDISDWQWNSCKQIFDNKCAYCGLPIKEHYITYRGNIQLGDFHKEHVDHFGSNGIENLLPACKSCNSRKWEFPFKEWYNVNNPIFSKERYEKIIWWLEEGYKQLINK